MKSKFEIQNLKLRIWDSKWTVNFKKFEPCAQNKIERKKTELPFGKIQHQPQSSTSHTNICEKSIYTSKCS